MPTPSSVADCSVCMCLWVISPTFYFSNGKGSILFWLKFPWILLMMWSLLHLDLSHHFLLAYVRHFAFRPAPHSSLCHSPYSEVGWLVDMQIGLRWGTCGVVVMSEMHVFLKEGSSSMGFNEEDIFLIGTASPVKNCSNLHTTLSALACLPLLKKQVNGRMWIDEQEDSPMQRIHSSVVEHKLCIQKIPVSAFQLSLGFNFP